MNNSSETFVIHDLHSLSSSEAGSVMGQIARIEKRTFPSSEAFEFDILLWRRKPNTRVIYATFRAAPVERRGDSSSKDIAAYAVYARTKGIALLHKICVAQPHRGRGLGKLVMGHVEQRLREQSCQSIHLWVDKDRQAARRLYSARGFEEREVVADYYGPGRTGIKMVLDLNHPGK